MKYTRRAFNTGLSLAAVPIPQTAQTRLPAWAVTDLGGFLGRRLRLSAEHYLKPFQVSHWTEMVESRTYKDWWWTGEQPGKWLHSAIAASETLQDKALRV